MNKPSGKLLSLSLFMVLIGVSFLTNYCGSEKCVKNDVEQAYADFKGNFPVLKKSEPNMFKPGDTVLVELEMQAGTGYDWYFSSPKDSKKFKVLDKKVFHLQKKENKSGVFIGGRLKILWKIKIIKSGELKLTFKHYRKWEGEGKSVKQAEYKVQVGQIPELNPANVKEEKNEG